MRTIALFLSLLVVPLASQAADVELPFELDQAHDLLLVRTVVDHKPALLILDTGTARTMLSPALMGVDPTALKRSRFAGGGFDGRGVWSEATIAIGEVTLRHCLVGAVDMTAIRETYHRPIDGLLGQDILRQFKRVVIDYERRVVVLSKA